MFQAISSVLMCFTFCLIPNGGRGQSTELIICEGEDGDIQCDRNDTVIHIEDAFYGRRNMSICVDSDTELKNVHCMAPRSLPKVWEACNGKRSCTLRAENDDFGVDPCPRLRKYLSVFYRCDVKGSEVIGDCSFEFWHPWMNSDSPSGTGDYETFYRHRASLPEWCTTPDAVQIQLADGRPVSSSNDVIRSGANYGVSCSNVHQTSGKKCGDYRARFCCSSDCATEIRNQLGGSITSPNFPKNYDPNSDCSWIIVTDHDKYITFSVDFLDLESRKDCIFDSLKIYDLGKGEEVFSGCRLNSNSSMAVEVSGNRAQVRFMSDANSEGPGFKLEWKAKKVPVCRPPTAPLFGGVEMANELLWREGTVVRYFCNDGFAMSGADRAQCQETLKWSNPRPVCKANCAAAPGEYYERLPDFCLSDDGSPKYVNVGKCSNEKCQSVKNITSNEDHCCRAALVTAENVDCGAFLLPVNKVVRCECGECLEEEVMLIGIAVGDDESDPLVNGTIQAFGEIVSTTNEDGSFNFPVKTSGQNLAITFSDMVKKKFLNKVQMVSIPEKGQKFLRVRMNKRPPAVRITSKSNSSVVLKSTSTDGIGPPPVGKLNIPANSAKNEDGDPYEGEIDLYTHTVDNQNPDSWEQSPGPLIAEPPEDDDDGLAILRNYGIFQFQANGANDEPLNLDNVEMQINASHVDEDDLPKMHIYSFNNSGGIWEDEGHLEVLYDVNDIGEADTFLIGTINITVDKVWSLNVLVKEYCYAKVRTYESDDFDHRDQLDDVSIKAVYMGSDGRWKGYSSEMTMGGIGACVMVPCRGNSGIEVIHFTASTSDLKDLTAAPSRPFRADIVGFTQFLSDLMKYRRFDHEDKLLSQASFNITLESGFGVADGWYGPIYSSGQSDRCFLAPQSDYHFRFYQRRKKARSALVPENNKYTAVGEGEDTSDPRYWGPSEDSDTSKVCYIKVSLRVNSARIRATSSGGTHPNVSGQLYGYRQELANSSSICLEFKCAKLFEDGLIERPFVVVNVLSGGCHLATVNPLLAFYLSRIEPVTTSQVGDRTLTMYAPTSPLGADFGIYTSKMSSYDEAKMDALSQCNAGSSLLSKDKIRNHDAGIAIAFEC